MDKCGDGRVIAPMSPERLSGYAELYSGAFSAAPWSEPWTPEAAEKRIGAMMSAPTFIGLELCDEGVLKGFIFGQKEYHHSGAEFQIQEFCVAESERGKGYGTALLGALREKLAEEGITGGTYLVTGRMEDTAGWYASNGFCEADGFIVMNDK
ncbi:MAG: GNAT family N-acetyltransferase [Ruminococcus sp.]|nr:GNAT family N-acetyltransferase [Ruminococcus sp.]